MKIDNNTSLSFDLGTVGLITFIVFICLKCSGVCCCGDIRKDN